MPKNLSLKILVFIGVNLLIKPIWIFGVERNIQLIVGFADYGSYYAVFNFAFLGSILCDMGIHTYNVRATSRNHQLQEINPADTLTLKLGLTIAYILFVLIAGWLLGYQQSHLLGLLLLLLFYQAFLSFVNYLRTYLVALQLFKLDTFIAMMEKSLLICLFLPFIFLQKMHQQLNIYTFALGQLLSVFVVLVFTVMVLQKHVKINIWHIDFGKGLDSIKKLLPFTLFSILVLAYNKIDSIMLERLLVNGKEENGNYAAAYRILDAASMLPAMAAYFVLPVLSKMIYQQKSIQKLMLDYFNTLISLLLIFTITCIVFREELMRLLYSQNSSHTLSNIFGLLMASFVFIGIYYVYSTSLTASGNLKALNIIAWFGLCLNIGLNFWLIPETKAEGAALATLISLAFTGFAYAISYFTFFKYPFPFLGFLRMLLLAILLYYIEVFFKTQQINWLYLFFILPFAGLMLAYMLKTISLVEIKNYIKTKS